MLFASEILVRLSKSESTQSLRVIISVLFYILLYKYVNASTIYQLLKCSTKLKGVDSEVIFTSTRSGSNYTEILMGPVGMGWVFDEASVEVSPSLVGGRVGSDPAT
jgi:hypothetical protein